MSKYNPRKIIANSIDNSAYLAYFTSMIISAAKYALLEEVSPNNAKKEISSLLENIKEIKKDINK